jgi:hypothetical protein
MRTADEGASVAGVIEDAVSSAPDGMGGCLHVDGFAANLQRRASASVR